MIVEQVSEHILWAKIDRPQARNAVNFEMIDNLEKLVSDIESNKQVRVFIFSGTGTQSFIAGGDLKEFHTITEKEEAIKMSERMQALFNRIEQLPCWNIAFVNGDAYGGGVELMMAFDFILSAPHSKFGFTQGKFYLTPGWGGLTRLVERAGRSKALEWQGKAEIKSVKEMLSEGFINHIVEEKDVLDWAEKLTRNDRDFILTLKQSASGVSGHRYEAMKAEIEPFSKLWVHSEHASRVEKFMNKNK